MCRGRLALQIIRIMKMFKAMVRTNVQSLTCTLRKELSALLILGYSR